MEGARGWENKDIGRKSKDEHRTSNVERKARAKKRRRKGLEFRFLLFDFLTFRLLTPKPLNECSTFRFIIWEGRNNEDPLIKLMTLTLGFTNKKQGVTNKYIV